MIKAPRYEVTINNFIGPLDLLLHLIKEKEVDIFSVDLSEISNQFINYIAAQSELNIEIASEYLVMASYLVEIKSKLILPKEEVEIDDQYEEDQREELIKRLLEYKKIKEASKYFKTQHEWGMQYLSRPRVILKNPLSEENLLPLSKSVTIDKLTNSFQKMLERINANRPLSSNIVVREVSPEEMGERLLTILQQNPKKWLLEELLSNFELSLQVLVACFIALLDLARHQIVNLSQSNHLDIIYIEYNQPKEKE